MSSYHKDGWERDHIEEESSVRAFWDLGVGEVEDLPQLSPLSAGVGEERWSYGIWVAKLQAAGFSVLPSSPLIPAAGPLPTTAAFFPQSGDLLSMPLSPFCNSVLFSLLCLCLSVGMHVSPPSAFLPPFFPLPRFCFSHLCVSLPVSPSPFAWVSRAAIPSPWAGGSQSVLGSTPLGVVPTSHSHSPLGLFLLLGEAVPQRFRPCVL